MIKQILFFSVLRKWEFHKIENCNLITHKSSDLRFSKKVSRVEILKEIESFSNNMIVYDSITSPILQPNLM